MNLQEKTISLLKHLGRKLGPDQRAEAEIQQKLHLDDIAFRQILQHALDCRYIQMAEKKVDMTAEGVARLREVRRKEFDLLSPDIYNEMYDLALYTFLDKDELVPIEEFPEILINECPVQEYMPHDNMSHYLSQKEGIENGGNGYKLSAEGKARLQQLKSEKEN